MLKGAQTFTILIRRVFKSTQDSPQKNWDKLLRMAEIVSYEMINSKMSSKNNAGVGGVARQ